MGHEVYIPISHCGSHPVRGFPALDHDELCFLNDNMQRHMRFGERRGVLHCPASNTYILESN